MRIGRRGEKGVVSAKWVDRQVKDNIKKRKYMSRAWRQTWNKQEPQEKNKRIRREIQNPTKNKIKTK